MQFARSCPTVYLLVGPMSDDLVGLPAAYMRYQEGCSDNLKRSIESKEGRVWQPFQKFASLSVQYVHLLGIITR